MADADSPRHVTAIGARKARILDGFAAGVLRALCRWQALRRAGLGAGRGRSGETVLGPRVER
ncbi:MAG: hypothetical protein ACYDAR_11180 [Thermomicrobiales bacterium]